MQPVRGRLLQVSDETCRTRLDDPVALNQVMFASQQPLPAIRAKLWVLRYTSEWTYCHGATSAKLISPASRAEMTSCMREATPKTRRASSV